MATNEPPIEDPYRRSRRITVARPTRRIGRPADASQQIPIASSAPSVGTFQAGQQPVQEKPAAPLSTAVTRDVSKAIAPAGRVPAPPMGEIVVHEPTGPSRYHRIQPPKLHPDKRHRTGNSASSAITITVLSALLLGYAFNIASIQAAADAALSKMNGSAQAQGSSIVPILENIVPWLILLPVAFLFYVIMKSLAAAIGLSHKRKIRTGRENRKRPLDEFKALLAAEGISSRTAYQAYLLLQPYLKEDEAPYPEAVLEDHLGMTPAQVRDIHLSLLRATEREADPAGRIPQVSSILDLVAAVQRAPQKARAPLPPVFEPGDPGVKNR